MTQSMSVTRALVELKTLGDRIDRAIGTGVYVGVQIGKDTKAKYTNAGGAVLTQSDLTQKIQSSFDSVNDLIDRRQKIKSAVILSNAVTKVTFGGKEITVAEAIELKSTITFRHQYLSNLRMQFASATKSVTDKNVLLELKIDKLIETSYSSEKTKVDAATVDAIAKPQRDQHEAVLFDPSKIESKIDEQVKLLEQLESEIDFVLSESNARTSIVV